MVFRFIYRTMRIDFNVLKLESTDKLQEFIAGNYDFILIPTYDIFPQVPPPDMRTYLSNRGWLYIGDNLPTLYEAADIERICLIGNKQQQQMYYNRQGEFSLIEGNTKKIITDCKINPDSFYF